MKMATTSEPVRFFYKPAGKGRRWKLVGTFDTAAEAWAESLKFGSGDYWITTSAEEAGPTGASVRTAGPHHQHGS